jgi:hypothetical protein
MLAARNISEKLNSNPSPKRKTLYELVHGKRPDLKNLPE